MSRLLAPGPVAGILGAAASIAVAFNKPALGAILGDPTLPGKVLAGIAFVTPILAGFLHNGAKPTAPLI